MASLHMHFQKFLTSFEAGVEVLARRVEAADPQDGEFGYPVFQASFLETLPDAPCIWVGTGNWESTREGDVCLNSKGAGKFAGIDGFFGSVTALAESDTEVVWSRWQAAIGQERQPEQILARFQLVAEDASPDSCFGLLCFLARLNDVAVEEIPRAWSDYVKRWESGDVLSTGVPEHSYGALHSAIYHSLLDSGWGGAWVAVLRFMLNALKQELAPEDLSTARSWGGLVQARSLVEFERQAYEASLNYATTLQLRLPIAAAPERTRLVDAYLSEEHIPLGLLKNFVRTDVHNTVLKSGFTLMGIHKPYDPGSSGDFLAVSVTPDAGVHLLDLWKKLEELEDKAWARDRDEDGRPLSRPCDNPRVNMIVYPDGLREDGSPAPNNPWFITNDYTLIAAPHPDASGQPGTKLTWTDVTEAIWHCYQPLRTLEVRNHDGNWRRLDDCRPINSEDDELKTGKKLILAHWNLAESDTEGSEGQFYIRFTPTLNRFLAASIALGGEKRVQLRDLPQRDHFDFVEFKGGFGVVTSDGAYVIDDWQRDPLDTEGVIKEFNQVVRRRHIIDEMSQQTTQLYDEVRQKLNKGLSGKDSSELLNRIAAMQLKVGELWHETMPSSYDVGIIQFRSTLEKRFGIAGRLESFSQSIQRISSMLNSYIELRTNSRVAWLTIFGFPIVLFASFFGFIFKELPNCPATESAFVNWLCTGVNVYGLSLFLVLTLLGVIAFRYWNRRLERASRVTDFDPPVTPPQ